MSFNYKQKLKDIHFSLVIIKNIYIYSLTAILMLVSSY